MTEQGAEIIGREILRIDAEAERDRDIMGKSRRTEMATRRKALVRALHAVLTGDTARLPGVEVDAFLKTLDGS